MDSVFQVRNSELKHINSLSVWDSGSNRKWNYGILISYPDLTLFYTGRGRSGYEINGILELYFRFQSPGFRIPRAKIPGVWIPETKFPKKEKDKIFQHKIKVQHRNWVFILFPVQFLKYAFKLSL